MKKKEILIIFVLILFLTILAAAGLKVFNINNWRGPRITIILKINPPNFAIVKWPFNTHQIGLEEQTKDNIILDINRQRYTITKSPNEPEEITVYEGFESGVNYKLLSFDNEQVILEAYLWAAPPASLPFFYQPSVIYKDQRFTDYQLIDIASSKATTSYEEAIKSCLETSTEPIQPESFTFRDICLRDIAEKIARSNFSKAVEACKQSTGQFVIDFCLEKITGNFIWNNPWNKVLEQNQKTLFCTTIIDSGEKEFCERGFKLRQEKENCFSYKEGSKKAECLTMIAIRLKKEAIDEESAEVVCRQILDVNLSESCLKKIRGPN